VKAGESSEPFLMTGFDRKMLHLKSDKSATFVIEVDFLGNGEWVLYEKISTTGASNYARHIFPEGFSAHWVRLTPETNCTASAEFFYS
jgi:hypothetical protein